jgi:hypothetical protein
MKQVRSEIFESNSSSSHSVSICVDNNKDGIYDTILPDDNGVITLTGGTFSSEGHVWLKAIEKANYCVSYIETMKERIAERSDDDEESDDNNDEPVKKEIDYAAKYTEMLKKVVCDHAGAKQVIINPKKSSYISEHCDEYGDNDEKEESLSHNPFKSEKKLKDLIFNRWSYVMSAYDGNRDG